MHIQEINENCDLESTDLEDRLCEILDDFCESLSKEEGMVRPTEEDDYLGDYERTDIPFMWTDKAARLIDEEINRVHLIASKYYNEKEMLLMNIYTNWYCEL